MANNWAQQGAFSISSEEPLKSLWLTLLVALGSVTAHAAPVTYDINFITTSGIAPVSGSFTYDSSNSIFTAFQVVWNNVAFNLVSSANMPGLTGVCDTPNPDPADFFTAITSGCGGGAASWLAFTGPIQGGSHFQIQTLVNGGSVFVSARVSLSNTDPRLVAAEASGLIAIPEVPEPSTWVLMSASSVLLLLRSRPRQPFRS